MARLYMPDIIAQTEALLKAGPANDNAHQQTAGQNRQAARATMDDLMEALITRGRYHA